MIEGSSLSMSGKSGMTLVSGMSASHGRPSPRQRSSVLRMEWKGMEISSGRASTPPEMIGRLVGAAVDMDRIGKIIAEGLDKGMASRKPATSIAGGNGRATGTRFGREPVAYGRRRDHRETDREQNPGRSRSRGATPDTFWNMVNGNPDRQTAPRRRCLSPDRR